MHLLMLQGCHSRGRGILAGLLGYMKEIAEVLDLMNEQFNLHFDIKPQNIFLMFVVKVGTLGWSRIWNAVSRPSPAA